VEFSVDLGRNRTIDLPGIRLLADDL